MRTLYIFTSILISLLLLSMCGTETKETYRLTTEAVPTEGGVVIPLSGDYEEGETVSIEAVPSEGWLFVRWDGNVSGSENPTSLVVETNNKWVNAIFEKRDYLLTINIEGSGEVREKIVQSKTTEYPFETVVELTPAASTGWKFKEWSGDESGDVVPIEVRITDGVTITAHFVEVEGSFFTMGGSELDIAHSVTNTTDGGVVLTGYTTSNNGDFDGLFNGDFDIFVIKLNNEGKVEWIRVFGDIEFNQGYSITETMDGGIVLSGKIFAGRWTTLVMKLDQSGNIIWEREFYKGSGEALTATADGGVVVTGFSSSDEGIFEGLHRGMADVFLLKLGASGDVEWVQNYGGSSGEEGRSVVEMDDGGYLVSGWAYSTDGTFEGLKEDGNMAGFLIRTDQTGEVEWTRFLSERSDIYNFKIESPIVAKTIDGRIMYLYSDCKGGEIPFSINCRSHLLEVDRDGDTLWKRTYSDSNSSDAVSSMFPTSDGSLIMTGSIGSTDGDFTGVDVKGRSDIMIKKVNSSGEIQWVKTYGGTSPDWGASIVQTVKGEYIVVGNTFSNDGDFKGMNRGYSDIFVLKVDQNGDLLPQW